MADVEGLEQSFECIFEGLSPASLEAFALFQFAIQVSLGADVVTCGLHVLPSGAVKL